MKDCDGGVSVYWGRLGIMRGMEDCGRVVLVWFGWRKEEEVWLRGKGAGSGGKNGREGWEGDKEERTTHT